MKQNNYPFTFMTEASVNLAEDQEMLDLMVEAGFYAVFFRIETPDQDSLPVTCKMQNTRNPLIEAGSKINGKFGIVAIAKYMQLHPQKLNIGKSSAKSLPQTPSLGLSPKILL